MRYDLSQSFPLITTNEVFWKGVANELSLILRGQTNAQLLSDKEVKIRGGNASRKFLDKMGLTEREEWDLGPIHGFQWRHFGAEYKTMHEEYTDQGVDQIADVIKQLKQNPDSRMMLISAWNPEATKKMAVAPCQILAQFYV